MDPEAKNVRVVRPLEEEYLTAAQLTWAPAGALESLVVDVSAMF